MVHSETRQCPRCKNDSMRAGSAVLCCAGSGCNLTTMSQCQSPIGRLSKKDRLYSSALARCRTEQSRYGHGIKRLQYSRLGIAQSTATPSLPSLHPYTQRLFNCHTFSMPTLSNIALATVSAFLIGQATADLKPLIHKNGYTLVCLTQSNRSAKGC